MAKKKVTRRGNGEGSIYQRKPGQWAAVITVGLKPDGKPNRKFLYGKTRAEVATKLREAQNNKDLGVMPTSGNILYKTWVTNWLENVIRPGVEDRATYIGYANYVYNHIIPDLGHYKLANLTQDIIQAFLDQQSATGSLDKILDPETDELVESHGPLSDSTVIGIRRLVIASLDAAVEHKNVTVNPAKKTRRPKTSSHNKMNIFNEHEREEFCTKAVKYRQYPAYMFAFATGCRRGEVIGLPWRDVFIGPSWKDIDNAIPWDRVDKLTLWDTDALADILEEVGIEISDKANVYIEQAVVSDENKKPALTDPKTELSRRRLYIPFDMCLIFIFQRRVQYNDMVRHVDKGRGTAKDYNKNGLCFCTRKGGIIYPRNFSKTYAANLASMGIKHNRFHDLRHMVATILLEEGEAINTVQEQLGHYDAGFTASRYGHVTDKMRKGARDQLGSSLAAARGTKAENTTAKEKEAVEAPETEKQDAMVNYLEWVGKTSIGKATGSIEDEIDRVKEYLGQTDKLGTGPMLSYMTDYLEFLERKRNADTNIISINTGGQTAAKKKS